MKGHLPPRHEKSNSNVTECQLRDESRHVSNAHQTTVIVYDNEEWTKEFTDFVRFSWLMQQQAIVGGVAGDEFDFSRALQLVLFHPHATHHTCACFGPILLLVLCIQ